MKRPPPNSTLLPYTTLFRSPFAQPRASIIGWAIAPAEHSVGVIRSEEHTSELQSRGHIVCRLLLEKNIDRTDQVAICEGSGNLRVLQANGGQINRKLIVYID